VTDRTARWLAWAVWGLTVASLAGWVVLAVLNPDPDDGSEFVVFPIAVLGFATVGSLISSRRPDNRIGWIFAWIGLAAAAGLMAGAYAEYGIDYSPGSLPAVRSAAWLGRVGFALMIGPFSLVFLLFPDGRVPSERWRPLLWLLLAALAVSLIGFALAPGSVNSGFTELHRPTANPVSFPFGWKGIVETVTVAAGFVALACGFLSVIALFLRFRRARAEERQQIRWLAYVGATAFAGLLISLIVELVRTLGGIDAGDADPVVNILFFIVIFALILGVPAASGIAILRYRLYDLDIVVKKTVVFAVLALFITAAYLLAVGLVGAFVADQSTSTVAFAAGAVAALAFQPVRALARRLADRLVYGKRASPYEVLSEFSDRVAGTYSTEDVLPRMAQILAAGTGAERAQVWLVVGGSLRPAASWPTEGRTLGAPIPVTGDRLPEFPPGPSAFEVRHQGELLGALTVTMPVSDPMDPARAKLVQDMAAQAGLVLRNVRLIEELRASRQRLVAAQDEERRRIERDIHDGAQQQLVALAVRLRLAEHMADRDPAKAKEMLGQLQGETNDALENLRDLARGIYPPLLADKGLAAALESQARKSPVPTEMVADGVGRFPQEVETAVYFCTLEALQNVAKYANATRATVRLSAGDEGLSFEVSDDGAGFDPSATAYGTGLQGMADRLDAIGGTLQIRSAPNRGTTVTGRVPVPVGVEGR